jgi:cell volume regulation protein A
VGQEHEEEPPHPPRVVELELAKLDHGEIERGGEGQEEDPGREPQDEEEQHGGIVSRCGQRVTGGARLCPSDRFAENRPVSTKDIILTLGVMLVAGLVCQLIADTLRAPRMLVLLLGGVVLGPSVTDAIDVPLDSTGAELLLTLGVSFILFFGGLQLSTRILSRVAIGLTLLAVPGVVITAFVAGSIAAVAFDVPFSTGLLIGAVLAPTDPAILIPLFARIGIRQKIEQTAIAESALNDATGAVLALVLAGVVVSGNASVADPALDFVEDLAISTALGIAFGIVLSLVVSDRRAGVWKESAAIAVVAVVAVGYFSTDSAGGSGYLGAFLAGLIVGNMDRFRLGMHTDHERDMRSLVGTITEVVVILVFITLGANLPWGDIWDNLFPALVVVGVGLVLLARPLTVLACLLPDRRGRWTREEIVFLSWTRETGVVAAALAGLMVSRGIEDAELIVTTVAVAIVVTLGVQTTTKVWLGRRLGLEETYDQG